MEGGAALLLLWLLRSTWLLVVAWLLLAGCCCSFAFLFVFAGGACTVSRVETKNGRRPDERAKLKKSE